MREYKKYSCINCNKESRFKYSGSNLYCGQTCQLEFQYKKYITDWKAGCNLGGNKYATSNHVKRYILEKFDQTCCECKIKSVYNGKPIILEIDHIDGNPYNNNEENLRCICPNCHSQSHNYKNKNKGNGRAYRTKYYAHHSPCSSVGRAPVL